MIGRGILLSGMLALGSQVLVAQGGKAFLKEGDRLRAQRQWEEAVEKYSYAIQVDPGLIAAYQGRAEAAGALGRMAERARDLGAAAALAPAKEAYAEEASGAYFDLDSLPAARRFAEQAVHAAPKSQAAQLVLARACLGMGDLDCAAEASDRALALKATTDTYYMHGVVRSAMRDYQAAEQDLGKVLEWNRLYEPAYLALSEVLIAQHDLYTGTAMQARALEKAVGNCTRALELNPQSTDALFIRSKAYGRQKEYAKAIDDVSRCMALGRNDRAVFVQRSEYYKGFGQYQNAVNDLNRVVLDDPKDAEALLLRSECREANLDLDGALKDLDAAERILEGDGRLSAERREAMQGRRARIDRQIFEMNREADPPAITVVRPYCIGDVAKVGSSQAFVEVSGHVRDKSLLESIAVNGFPAEFRKEEMDPEFAIRLPLPVDAQEIIVQATDVYGNTSGQVLRVERSEGIAPTIEITSPRPTGTRQLTLAAGRADVFIEGRVSDASLIRRIAINDVNASFAPDRSNPDFSMKVDLQGQDRFILRAEDQYGNAAVEEWSVARAAEQAAAPKPAPAEAGPSAGNGAQGGTWLVSIENISYLAFPAAQGADAAKMQKAFASYQIQRTIRKKNLTKEQLERFFNVELRDMVRAGKVNTILVWYSGHGSSAGGKAYWIPVDGKKDDAYSFYNYGALKAQMQNYSESVTNTVVVSDAAGGDSFFDLTR